MTEPGTPKRNKKARKNAGRPTPGPRTEVLPIAEAERRYGSVAAPKTEPSEAPSVGVAAPAVEEAPPPVARPVRDPADAARRTEAAENRRRAQVPRFHALLSRTDALLAVSEVEPRHLASSRRQLLDGWAELGRPPKEEAEALSAARDARLAAIDERLRAAAAVADVAHQAMIARRWEVVEEARALAEREDLRGAGPAMGELRARLVAVGRVAPGDPTTVAFAAAEARLKQRQEQLRTDRDTARQEQLERLEQLVQRAETLAASSDAETAAERVKTLQTTWKTIRVPGPRAEVDALWARFRTACDAVFAARTTARAESGRVSLERLEAIVVRTEALAESGVDGDPDDEIEKVLTAWKRVGRAPREGQQALWERLQRAFDQLRSPSVDLGVQDESSLQFRPFEGLVRDDES